MESVYHREVDSEKVSFIAISRMLPQALNSWATVNGAYICMYTYMCEMVHAMHAPGTKGDVDDHVA